jgi:hypothetical protein
VAKLIPQSAFDFKLYASSGGAAIADISRVQRRVGAFGCLGRVEARP